MASAADLVIAEINELVEVGEIAAENVKTPSIMVDFIIENWELKIENGFSI